MGPSLKTPFLRFLVGPRNLYRFSPFGYKTVIGDLDMRPHPEALGTTLYQGSHHHLIGKVHGDRELSSTHFGQ